MLNNTLRLSFWYLKIIQTLHPPYHPKIIWLQHILKNKQKENCICIHEIIRLIIMKIKVKMKKRSHRYDINRPRSRHGHRYSKYKKCLGMMMLIFIKQRLSNIWSPIHEIVNGSGQKMLLIKKLVVLCGFRLLSLHLQHVHKNYYKNSSIFDSLLSHTNRCSVISTPFNFICLCITV